jgi:hypothetical protein
MPQQSQPSFFADFDGPIDPQFAPASPVGQEIRRLNAAAVRVLERLQRGPAMNWELATPDLGGLRAVGRIWELQQDGWDITKEHVERGCWRYRLVGRKEL